MKQFGKAISSLARKVLHQEPCNLVILHDIYAILRKLTQFPCNLRNFTGNVRMKQFGKAISSLTRRVLHQEPTIHFVEKICLG